MKCKIEKFLQSLLDPAGKVSFGRVMSLLITVVVLSWDTANLVFAWKFNHHNLLPNQAPLSLLPDPTVLIAQGGLCTLFYGVTKFGDVKMDGNQQQ